MQIKIITYNKLGSLKGWGVHWKKADPIIRTPYGSNFGKILSGSNSSILGNMEEMGFAVRQPTGHNFLNMLVWQLLIHGTIQG